MFLVLFLSSLTAFHYCSGRLQKVSWQPSAGAVAEISRVAAVMECGTVTRGKLSQGKRRSMQPG
jgi:hypothetical protein